MIEKEQISLPEPKLDGSRKRSPKREKERVREPIPAIPDTEEFVDPFKLGTPPRLSRLNVGRSTSVTTASRARTAPNTPKKQPPSPSPPGRDFSSFVVPLRKSSTDWPRSPSIVLGTKRYPALPPVPTLKPPSAINRQKSSRALVPVIVGTDTSEQSSSSNSGLDCQPKRKRASSRSSLSVSESSGDDIFLEAWNTLEEFEERNTNLNLPPFITQSQSNSHSSAESSDNSDNSDISTDNSTIPRLTVPVPSKKNLSTQFQHLLLSSKLWNVKFPQEMEILQIEFRKDEISSVMWEPDITLRSVLENLCRKRGLSLFDFDIMDDTGLPLDLDRTLKELKVYRVKFQRKSKVAPSSFIQDPSYHGPHIDVTSLTSEYLAQLINAFQEGIQLHYHYVYLIMTVMKKHLLENCSVVTDLNISPDKKLIIVGDLHGQLDDLLTILRIAGMPNEHQYYLFNGDFVDRGTYSIEVLLIIYTMKLTWIDKVFLNRGNHETDRMNAKYGFSLQIKQLYDNELLALIQETFDLLPLITILDKSIFVVHGGLSSVEELYMNELRNLPRSPLPAPTEITTREDLVRDHLLWSDPVNNDEFFEESDRGSGIFWGSALTEEFLANNNLAQIIRSHEMCQEGYAIMHQWRTITVFSASRYCGQNTNKGAFITYQAGKRLIFKSYIAKRETGGIAHVSSDYQIRLQQKKEIVKKLSTQIYQNRHKLFKQFQKFDPDETCVITFEDFSNAMKKGLGMDLHWSTLCVNLGMLKTPQGEMINYSKFLDGFVPHVMGKVAFVMEKKQKRYVRAMCEKIYERTNNLVDAYKVLDADHDGKLNYAEFSKLLKSCNLGLSKGQMYDFLRTIDQGGTGTIAFEEFVSLFQVEFKKTKAANVKPEDVDHIKRVITQLGVQIFKDKDAKGKFKLAFKSFGAHKGGITYEQFSSSLKKLGMVITDSETRMVFDYIDSDHNCKISFSEFKKVFDFVDKKLSTWTNPELFSEIQGKKSQILVHFVNADEKGDGKVKSSDFAVICIKMNFTQLNERDIFEMSHSLADSNNMIDYNQFLNCFEVDCIT